jgi:predicted DCC family thiol-disulfide oxidoreductase YuxK
MRERAAEDCDGYCYECATAIRALPTTFTDAELLAAAMQLPEGRALVDAADDLLNAITAENKFGDRSLTITGPTANLKLLMGAEDDALAAIAPFTKGAS